MEGEDAFFAAPPAEEPTDAPILLGAPTEMGEDMGFAGGDDAFAAPPAVEDTPIVLAPAPVEEEPMVESPAPIVPIEPGPMQKWNEEWQTTLAARREVEDASKAEMVEAAKIAMEKFNKDREVKRESKMAKNREDEQAKLEAIEADLENDNSWQKVSKMVELTQDGSEQAEDVKRMKDVLILLKNEPSRAEAVGA